MAYSFIKAIIRNELMFNCYYLHNYHLTTGPYFKMVRKVKAAKKPGIREILQSAVAGGHWYSIPKYLGLGKRESEELKFQQAGKWLLKETEGYKENLSSRQWLKGLVYHSFPGLRLELGLRGWENCLGVRMEREYKQKWVQPEDLAWTNVLNCFMI